MLAIILIITGVTCRVLTHDWNFTPVLAIALFAGACLPKRFALVVPLALMAVSDAVLGLHATIPFTWGSMALIALLGGRLRQERTSGKVVLSSLASAGLFFVVTNFGVWLIHYPGTVADLIRCYTVAIPFFRNTVTSTLVYSLAFFASYDFVMAKARGTKLADVL